MSNKSNTPDVAGTMNLVQAAAANGSFTTFGKALGLAGLSDTLSGTGPFTVFAPTDAAFAKLPAGELDTLFKPENKADLVAMLNYHVVSGRKPIADIGKWKSARTVNGQSAPIALDGTKVTFDGAKVCAADIDSSNGIIHGVDTVNIPTRQ